MTKKIASLILAFCIAFSLSSCSYKTVVKNVIELLNGYFDLTPDDNNNHNNNNNNNHNNNNHNNNNNNQNGTADHTCVFGTDGNDRVRLVKCSVEGCDRYGRQEDDGTFTELFEEYLDYADKKEEIFGFCDEFLTYIEGVEEYDPDKHGYKEGDEPDEGCKKALDMSERLDDYYYYVTDAFSIVQLYYYSDLEEFGETYQDAQQFSDDFKERYDTIEIACFECAYREYLFPESDGWTQEALLEEIEEARRDVDPDLIELIDVIQEVSYEIEQIDDTRESNKIPRLMEKLVEANNNFAKHVGYDNYYEYAWENEYGRDYDPDDVKKMAVFVKNDLTALMWAYYERYFDSDEFKEGDFEYSVLYGSIQSDRVACDAFYGFLKSVEEFQSDGDASYYESANDALKDGNLVFSNSENAFPGAYTDYLYGEEIPIMYFGSDVYSDVQSFVHEHGHYHAALTGSADQVSFDFNEIQSQGAELLYTSFLRDFFEERGEDGYKDVLTELVAFDLLTVVYSLADDEFERALYTGETDGIPDPERKLNDGVSCDEYDYLYNCILNTYMFEYGDMYWRDTVTKSPCYYISYAVSMVAALGILAEAENGDYESGVKAYLALFEVPKSEGYENREVSDIEYFCSEAGIGSPFEGTTYRNIATALSVLLRLK